MQPPKNGQDSLTLFLGGNLRRQGSCHFEYLKVVRRQKTSRIAPGPDLYPEVRICTAHLHLRLYTVQHQLVLRRGPLHILQFGCGDQFGLQ